MLLSLSIQNIVLIDKTEIKFSPGLCILTGETGSGKSILLDALGLAIGFRSNFRLIGSDESKASVAAEFDISQNQSCKDFLQEHDLLDEEDPNLLRIRRTIKEGSTGKIYLNDQIIGVNFLAKIGEFLVEIHGQHDQRGLLNPSTHLNILDDFCKNQPLLKNLKRNYEELREIDKKIAELKAKKEASKKEQDYLEHIISELETADVKDNEEQELADKKDQLNAKEKILNFLSDLKANFTEANSQLITAQRLLIRNQNIVSNFLSDEKDFFDKLSEKVDQENDNIDSSLSNIDSLIRDLNSSDSNLDEIEERLFYIRSLARKFNVTVFEIPQVINDAKEKLSSLQNEEVLTLDLEKTRKVLFENYKKIADQISEKRKKSAVILAKKIEEELKFLKMETSQFLVDVTFANTEEKSQFCSASGYDKVRFLASINKNNFDDISKIASGGELSRLMLALKVALMDVKSVPTMIFDEIDTGIGGMTADAVGKRLKTLSKNLQVFVVTHQAQIASKADIHFQISKNSLNKKVTTAIEKLDEKNRKMEIARMISGQEINKETLAAAESLIKSEIS